MFDKLQHRLARLCWGRTVAACVDTMARARDQQGRDTADMLATLSRQHRCGIAWDGYGMVWYGIVWYGYCMVWYGLVWT